MAHRKRGQGGRRRQGLLLFDAQGPGGPEMIGGQDDQTEGQNPEPGGQVGQGRQSGQAGRRQVDGPGYRPAGGGRESVGAEDAGIKVVGHAGGGGHLVRYADAVRHRSAMGTKPRRVQPWYNWRGRWMRASGSRDISRHWASQPGSLPKANSTVNMLGGNPIAR